MKLGAHIRNSKILLVDDVPDIQFIFKQFLECNGAEIVSAGTAEEAFRLASEETPNLILLDMHLPDMDGCAAAQRLRADGYEGPIVAITARVGEDERQQCLQAGCTHFIGKPVDYADLIGVVDEALSGPPMSARSSLSTTAYSH